MSETWDKDQVLQHIPPAFSKPRYTMPVVRAPRGPGSGDLKKTKPKQKQSWAHVLSTF